MPIIIPQLSEFRVRDEGDRVHVIVNGQVVIDVDWKGAQQLWQAIRIKQLVAEERAKAEQIARDSAILLRAGAPFALSARQDIKDEAVKLACHDRQLRQMPYIKSQEKFGHPSFEHVPKSNQEKKP